METPESSSSATHGEAKTEDAKEIFSRVSALLASRGIPLGAGAGDSRPVFQKGSTALAFVINEGVIVAVDHSVDYSVTSPEELPKNVVALNSHMLGTISGGNEYLLHDLQKQCLDYELKEGRLASAQQATKWVSHTLASKSKEGQHLSIGILIAGWNGSEPVLYRVKGEGTVHGWSFLSTGSGSDGAFGALFGRCRFDLTVAHAARLAGDGICLAINRAPEKLKYVGVYHVGRDGWCTKVYGDDVVEWLKNMKFPVR